MSKNKSLVAEREQWAENFINGNKPSNPALEDYRKFRNSESWRIHSSIEEVFEYILYLEKKLDTKKAS